MAVCRRTGESVTEAVLVFDARGIRRAASRDADSRFGARIASIADLASRFRSPDGTPLELEAPGTRVALGVHDDRHVRVAITTATLDPDLGADQTAASTVIAIRSLDQEDDPATLRLALGSILAHELRTPMTTIYGGAQLISNPAVSERTRAEAAESVARETQHLNRIVEDLVTLVRSGRDPSTDPEPVMLQHVLANLVKLESATRHDMPLKLSIDRTLPAVLAVQSQLEHVVRNLIHHALQYAPAAGTVRIEARRVASNVEISVADEGPARDDADAGSAFDLFHVSSRTAADPSGANLALVVTRRLVESMGGTIRATASASGGETVISLPIARKG